MRWLIDHLVEQKGPYVMVCALLFAAGAFGGSVGQQWLTATIDGRVAVRMTGIEGSVESLGKRFSVIEEMLLITRLQETQRQICLRPARHLHETLRELQQQYEEVKGRMYVLPPCSELVERS